jgi:sec-independent protein translocase protein TatA
MLNDLFSGWHMVIVFAAVVLLFGATRLPALARSLGQSRNAFREETRKGNDAVTSDNAATIPARPS